MFTQLNYRINQEYVIKQVFLGLQVVKEVIPQVEDIDKDTVLFEGFKVKELHSNYM